MSTLVSRAGTALAAAAALAMTASPVMARDWYGGGRHWHKRDRIDAGDVLAGVLVIGGIAAIASAASNASKARRDADYRYPERRDDNGRDYRDYRGSERNDSRDYGNRDHTIRGDDGYAPGARSGETLNGAVDACVNEVERADRRIDSVDTVSRTMDGYRVEGRVGNGRSFTCTVDGSGQVRSVAVDGRAI